MPRSSSDAAAGTQATPPTARAFHIGDVLSVVLGVVLSPRGAPGVAALYTHLLGRPYMPGDPDRYNAPLREHLLGCFPGLRTFRAAEVPTYEFVGDWVRRRACEFGTYLLVPPLSAADALDLWSATPAVPASVHVAGMAVRDRAADVLDPLVARSDETPTPSVPWFAAPSDSDEPFEPRVVPDGL